MKQENISDSNSFSGGDDGERGRGARGAGGAGAGRSRRKVGRLLADKTISIDYKNPQLLRNFVSDRGKLVPRRITGATPKEQRKLALAIKRARMIALMPFAVNDR
jgi:small subunit ribosomal protein S18